MVPGSVYDYGNGVPPIRLDRILVIIFGALRLSTGLVENCYSATDGLDLYPETVPKGHYRVQDFGSFRDSLWASMMPFFWNPGVA